MNVVMHGDKCQQSIIGYRLDQFGEQVRALYIVIGQETIGGQLFIIDERGCVSVTLHHPGIEFDAERVVY